MSTALKKLRESKDPDADHALEVIDLINSASIAGYADKLSRNTLGVSTLRVLYERDGEQVNFTVQLNARGRDKVIVGWEGGQRSPAQAQRALRLYEGVVELATSIESLG